jgi:hypothetical protein
MPNRGLKYGGPKRQLTALMGVFFFSGRTRPFIYTFGRSDQFRCQKSAPAGLRFAGIFPATGRPAETPCSSNSPRASPQANVFFFHEVVFVCVAQQREGKSTHTHTQTHKRDHVHRARGTSPPSHPAWACLCVFVCGACVVFETNFKCCAGVFECMSCLCMLVRVRWHLLCPPVCVVRVRAHVCGRVCCVCCVCASACFSVRSRLCIHVFACRVGAHVCVCAWGCGCVHIRLFVRTCDCTGVRSNLLHKWHR